MKSVTEVAKQMGCTRSWVWFLIQAKKLKAEKVGNTYVIEDQAVINYLKAYRRK